MPIGYVDRAFPDHYRPALAEVAFAAAHSFGALQYMVHPNVPGRPQQPDVPLNDLRDALAAAAIIPTLELNCRVTDSGHLPDGQTPIALLESFLPFIRTLGCPHVHLHATAAAPFDTPTQTHVENTLIEQFALGVERAKTDGFTFAFEHNAPGDHNGRLFASPTRCADALAAVPGLGFVWDWNHTHPDDAPGFMALAPAVTLVHVSDTPLPAVNHHLPLGGGTVNLAPYCRALQQAHFNGVIILEIGGLPVSGGYGKDKDTALIESKHHIEIALQNTQP